MHRKHILHPLEERVFYHIYQNNFDGVKQSFELIQESLKSEAAKQATASHYRSHGLPTLTCRDEHGCTFLLAALNKFSTHPKIYKYLFEQLKTKEDVVFNASKRDIETITPFSKILVRKDNDFLNTFITEVEQITYEEKDNKVWLQNIDGYSPFQYAGVYNNGEAMLILLKKLQSEENFVDLINLPDQYGNTALHHLCMQGTATSIIKELIENGVDATVINNQGKTPLDYLEQNQQEELKRIARQHTNVFPREALPLYFVLNEQRVHLLKLKNDFEKQIAILKTKPHLTTAGLVVNVCVNALIWIGGYGGSLYTVVKSKDDLHDPMVAGVALGGPVVAAMLSILTYVGNKKIFKPTIQPETWKQLLNHIKTDILEKLDEIKRVSAEQKDKSVKVTHQYATDVSIMKNNVDYLHRELHIRTVEELFNNLITIIDDFLPQLNLVRMSANLLQFKPKPTNDHILEMDIEDNEELTEKNPLIRRGVQ